jgi:hypothetical protein
MGEAGRDLDFAEEPVAAERLGDGRVDHLERDAPVVFEVLGHVDGRHAAAKLALDAVARKRQPCVVRNLREQGIHKPHPAAS